MGPTYNLHSVDVRGGRDSFSEKTTKKTRLEEVEGVPRAILGGNNLRTVGFGPRVLLGKQTLEARPGRGSENVQLPEDCVHLSRVLTVRAFPTYWLQKPLF